MNPLDRPVLIRERGYEDIVSEAYITPRAYLAALDDEQREGLALVVAQVDDPDAFTGHGYGPDAAAQSRESAMATGRAVVRALCGPKEDR